MLHVNKGYIIYFYISNQAVEVRRHIFEPRFKTTILIYKQYCFIVIAS